jgi:type VI secretion system secreted protein VgrG
MAEFHRAHAFVAKWEGGYVNDPADRGGETIFGISRRAHPHWAGWKMVDAGDRDSEALKRDAEKLYRMSYWGPILGDQYPSQKLATLVYQAAVNCGVSTAVRWLQKSLNANGANLKEDGKAGNHTLHAIHEADRESATSKVVEDFKAFQKAHYYELANKPDQRRFLIGWLNRVNAA